MNDLSMIPNESHRDKSEKPQPPNNMELCFIEWVFLLSNLINRCTDCLEEIYDDHDCIRDTVDATAYITKYTCRLCSCNKEEPMEKTWISLTSMDESNQLIEKYNILENFKISQIHDYFLESDLQNYQLIILKDYKKEPYYICSRPQRLVSYFNIQISSVHFLSVTYTNGEDTPVTLAINKEWLTVGNEILGPVHVLRMLEYQEQPFTFSMDYVLDIIDSNIMIFQLSSSQFLKIEKDGYVISGI
jgi:hypothetical protein